MNKSAFQKVYPKLRKLIPEENLAQAAREMVAKMREMGFSDQELQLSYPEVQEALKPTA